jgi:hypothetical protein
MLGYDYLHVPSQSIAFHDFPGGSSRGKTLSAVNFPAVVYALPRTRSTSPHLSVAQSPSIKNYTYFLVETRK